MPVRCFVALLGALAGCSPSMAELSTQPPTETAVREEVVELHRFFVAWFRGEVPATDEAFARLPAALADGFVIVSPTGASSERDAILGGVRGAHATWGDADDIRIDAVVVRRRTADTIIATYEEWQDRGGQRRGRLSTVVFDFDLHWLHLHETWLPPAT